MSDSWKIEVTVKGGWAGQPRVHTLDSGKLSGTALAHAQTVVEASGILSVEHHKQHGGGFGDAQTYEFEVTIGDTTHKLTYSDMDLPQGIRRLVELMEATDRH
jgi:hypothetical protein